jgi:hypothetical protein
MLFDWQNVAALAIVGVAVIYLARRFGRTMLHGGKGMCAVCVRRCCTPSAKTAKRQQIVPVETLTRPVKRS